MNRPIKPVGCAVRTDQPPSRVILRSHPGCAKRTMHVNNPLHGRKMTGFSYVEVLIAVVLIVVALVPAMDALLPGVAGSGIHEATAEDHYQLMARLEQVLAEPFVNLEDTAATAGNETTPTTYSDVFTYTNGRQITRNVFLSRYDGDNADTDNDHFTGTDDGLLWLQVRIAGTGASIESLVSDYD